LQPTIGNVGIGVNTPSTLLHINTTARTSGTNVNMITLSDTVTGVQTSGYGKRIISTSNNGSSVSAIAFEEDGGTNNDTAIVFYTQHTANALTERMSIRRTGIATFACQICATSGVKFGNGTGTLNYYEEGTFTPRIKNVSWTSNEGSGNAGWYTRIGNLVTVGGTISWGGGSGAQGNDLRIVCLPFTSNSTANSRNVGQIGAPGGDSIAYIQACKGQFVIVNDPNQASMYIIETYQSGTWATYTHGPTVNNSGVIYGFQMTYHI